MFSRCQFEIPMPKIACIGSHFIRIELLLLSIQAAYNRRITHLLLQLQKMLLSLLLGFSFVSQLLQLMILFLFIYYLWKCSVWLFRNFIAFLGITEQFVSVFGFDSHLESFFHSEQAPTLWFYTNSNVKPRLKVQRIGKCILHNFYLVIAKQIETYFMFFTFLCSSVRRLLK